MRNILFFKTVTKHVDGERLTLTQVQRSDMGGYLCIASNGIPPSVSKRYDVNVNCEYLLHNISLHFNKNALKTINVQEKFY